MRIAMPRNLVLLLWIVPFTIHAQPEPAGQNEFEKLCSEEVTTTYFAAMREDAITVRNQLCELRAEESAIFQSLTDFVARQRQQRPFSGFGGFVNMTSGAAVNDPLEASWAGIRVSPRSVPTFGQTRSDLEIGVAGQIFHVADHGRCDQEAQARGRLASPPMDDGDCATVVSEFIDLYNYAQESFASPLALAFRNAVRKESADWNEYIKKTRGQTLLELSINTKLYRNRYERATAGFTPAPDWQLIVLHPNLVVENVSEAVGGEQTVGALMLELVGINWWRQHRWYVPSGFSVVSIYADRPGVKDIGYGVALHFQSVYTLGFTSHDGDGGVFVSFDLLKLVQDKQKVLEAFGQ